MPTASNWGEVSGLTTLMSTDLNSQSDGANVLSSAISNDAAGEGQLYIDLELFVDDQVSSRDSDARVELYFLYAVDSNFDHGDSMFDPRPESLAVVFSQDATTTERTRTAVNVPIAPLDFKILLMNETGQGFPASGNTLKYRLHSVESQ